MSELRGDSISPEPLPSLSPLTHHCILHAVEGIAPQKGISEVLPQSGSHNISSFCKELAQLAHECSSPKPVLISTEELVPPLTIQNFYSDVITQSRFAEEIEKALIEATDVFGIELDKLHRICWEYYREAKKSSVSFPKWLSRECTYRLWLVFNQCLDNDSTCRMSPITLNEVVKRLIEMCCYTWSEEYSVSGREGDVCFPEFLECITDHFDKFSLDVSLTSEVISDLVDETVHGVLKKGFLEKKGHVRRNWSRRWFVLKRTILTYYSKNKRDVKGQLVLNPQTQVCSLPDKASHQYLFLVTCGATSKPFYISADDQKMKHDWMLAIKKAIALAKVTEEEGATPQEREELEKALSGFFLLKYGTERPHLRRQDSEVRQLKHLTTKRKYKKIQNIVQISEEPASSPTDREGERIPGVKGEGEGLAGVKGKGEGGGREGDYIAMKSSAYGNSGDFSSSSDDEDGYTHMEIANYSTSYSSSTSGGLGSVSSAGHDSVLSTSMPERTFIHDDVFNPDKTRLNAAPKSPKHGLKALPEHESKTGLEDSYYEECGVESPRYAPGSNVSQPEKTTPTHTSSPPPDTSYLTILPSPRATPPAEELSSPTHTTLLPPPPPPKNPSPRLPRPRDPSSPKREDDTPPVPPPRTKSVSPLPSPTILDRPLAPTRHRRKVSEPQDQREGEGKDGAGNPMKKSHSSGVMMSPVRLTQQL